MNKCLMPWRRWALLHVHLEHIYLDAGQQSLAEVASLSIVTWLWISLIQGSSRKLLICWDTWIYPARRLTLSRVKEESLWMQLCTRMTLELNRSALPDRILKWWYLRVLLLFDSSRGFVTFFHPLPLALACWSCWYRTRETTRWMLSAVHSMSLGCTWLF